jgi:hypothetical protein
LRAGILFQADVRRAIRAQRENLDVADIAGLEDLDQLVLGPGDVGLSERGRKFAKLQSRDAGARGCIR